MDNNILVIGNGFDLAHGLNTKYEHFIEYIRSTSYIDDHFLKAQEQAKLIETISKNGFIKYFLKLTIAVPGWVDFEREIEKITQEFSVFFKDYNTMISKEQNNHINPAKCSKLLQHLLLDFEISISIQGSEIIDPKFYSTIYGLNKTLILKHLKTHLDDLIRCLEIYLLRCERHYFNNNNKKTLKQICDINATYIITFNYTSTYQAYKFSSDALHIHGRLLQKNIVLGFNDTTPHELDFIYFKKYFQRLQKLTGYIDCDRFQINNAGLIESPIIHFYGHSLDKTDEDIICQLRTIAKQFIIYKYDQEDYEKKVINLIDIFGKKEATEMIQTGFIKFIPCE